MQIEKEQRLRILAENQILKEKEGRFRSQVSGNVAPLPQAVFTGMNNYNLQSQGYNSVMPTAMPAM